MPGALPTLTHRGTPHPARGFGYIRAEAEHRVSRNQNTSPKGIIYSGCQGTDRVAASWKLNTGAWSKFFRRRKPRGVHIYVREE